MGHTKRDKNRDANAKFKAALIKMYNDVDVFGDIKRNKKTVKVNDQCRGWAK